MLSTSGSSLMPSWSVHCNIFDILPHNVERPLSHLPSTGTHVIATFEDSVGMVHTLRCSCYSDRLAWLIGALCVVMWVMWIVHCCLTSLGEYGAPEMSRQPGDDGKRLSAGQLQKQISRQGSSGHDPLLRGRRRTAAAISPGDTGASWYCNVISPGDTGASWYCNMYWNLLQRV